MAGKPAGCEGKEDRDRGVPAPTWRGWSFGFHIGSSGGLAARWFSGSVRAGLGVGWQIPIRIWSTDTLRHLDHP